MAPIQLPTFQIEDQTLWRKLLEALKARKWKGTSKRVNASAGETDASGRWLKEKEWSDVVEDEPVRDVLVAMLPWLDMSKVRITVNAEFRTRWHFDRNKGFSYFAMLGDEFQQGACELEDGRLCEKKYLWYVFNGAEFLHRTRAWSGGCRFTVVLYLKEGAGLALPPGVSAFAIIVKCLSLIHI